jgi:cob(I)alamin adenosyltransferase
MAFKIYTKTGDEGKTGLIGGARVLKSDIRIEAYGTVDELNSQIGVVRDMITAEEINIQLKEVQDRLFTIGSHLASDPNKHSKTAIPDILESDIEYLEKCMDAMDENLPELKSFILPGGNLSASTAHVARCVCRRAERITVQMQANDEMIEPIIIKYLNRLSDYLFILARYLSWLNKVADNEWKPRVG